MKRPAGVTGYRRTGLAAAGLLLGASLVLGAAPREPAAREAGGKQAAPAELDPDIAAQVFRNGEGGFVVSEIAYALGRETRASTMCPKGLTGGIRAQFAALQASPAGVRREGETDQGWQRRLTQAVGTAPDGRNICLHPDAVGPDPAWRMVETRGAVADGIDIDGRDSRGGKAGACGREDFQGAGGQRGVDNQFFRVVGCTTGFQPSGQANGFQTEMYSGSWGILVTIKGVDDPRNDSDIRVGIYANADPIQLSAARAALPFATYAASQDERYRATTRGRIVDGVLTIDPVDVRFLNFVNSMKDERILRDATMRLTVTPDGGLEGYLAGYHPVENIYDVQFGTRNGRNARGELAPERLRVQTSMGRAGAHGYSCNGAYHAMLAAADGHPDPATGRCTSISTQYRIRMIPAFVVDARTQSVNAPLTMR